MQGMNFLQRIGKILSRPEHDASGGLGGWGWGSFWRGGYSYKAEAGPLWESSIPLACLKWEQRASVEAEIITQRKNDKGKWENDDTSPLLDLLANPNPHYDFHQLLDAIRFDYHLDGNAYIYKARSGSGQVAQLWWIPCRMIEPRWQEDGTEFISCYEYNVNGKIYAIPVEDIIHIRNGIDPRSRGRKGLSDFAAVLREVCSDNEAATYAAALLRNFAIPGVVIAPKPGKDGDAEMTREQRRRFKEMWQECFTGERRGEPFIQSIPIDVTMPGFSPQQLILDKIRKIPEERISAAFGIPAVVLGLGAGLEASTAKASHADAREQAYESCIIPTLYAIGRAMTRQLMNEFADIKTNRIWFDLSQVRVLQQDEGELYKRLSMAWKDGWLKRSEVRTAAGFESDKEDEIYNVKDQADEEESVSRETDPDAPPDDEPEEDMKALRRRIGRSWAKAVDANV